MGTLGYGMFGSFEVSPRIWLRGQVSGAYWATSIGLHTDTYGAEWDLSSLGLQVDFYPHDSRALHVSAGFIQGTSNLQFRYSDEPDSFVLDGVTYPGHFHAFFNSEGGSLYLGGGWNRKRQQRRYQFTIDLGILVRPKPTVIASGAIQDSGDNWCIVHVSSNGATGAAGDGCEQFPDVHRHLENEHKTLKDSRAHQILSFHPVLTFGLAFRF